MNGPARTIAGDTIEIAGVTIRLYGIDAPENRQLCQRDNKPWHCGQEATWALAYLIAGQWVICDERDRDRDGRVVAVCYIGGRRGIDINAWMVEHGWALADREYSEDYVAQEHEAQIARRGIWSGTFQAPWDSRQDDGK